MPGRPWPLIVIEEVKTAYEMGVPMVLIARELGCSHTQIMRWRDANAWTVKGFRLSQPARVRMIERGKWRVTYVGGVETILR